jgi:hypothetical protein
MSVRTIVTYYVHLSIFGLGSPEGSPHFAADP